MKKYQKDLLSLGLFVVAFILFKFGISESSTTILPLIISVACSIGGIYVGLKRIKKKESTVATSLVVLLGLLFMLPPVIILAFLFSW